MFLSPMLVVVVSYVCVYLPALLFTLLQVRRLRLPPLLDPGDRAGGEGEGHVSAQR